MQYLYTLWNLLQVWIAVYLLLPALLLLIYLGKKAVGLQFNIYRLKPKVPRNFHFAAIVTAHQDVRFIHPLVDSLCKQTYRELTIYVVADDCDVSGLHFTDSRVVLLRPEAPLHSKIKSIDHAVQRFVQPHDALVIFDADNLAHPKFMQVLNRYFQQGYRAVQTNMQPKNTDTRFARLDAIGDVFYNFTEREARMELGFSSAIWGLGIAIETGLYRQIIYQHFLGGFDKRIQADVVRRIPQLAFAREALVYDEKVSDGQTLQRQRTRWINAYFRYFGLAAAVAATGLSRLSPNLIFFGFVNMRPPLFLTVGLGGLFALSGLLFSAASFGLWAGVLAIFATSFVLIVALKSRNKAVLADMLYLPLLVFRQLLALLRLRKANKNFLQTAHHKVVYIDELLRHEPA